MKHIKQRLFFISVGILSGVCLCAEPLVSTEIVTIPTRGDISPVNSATYTINRSGVYKLTCVQSASGVPVITITANNVTLDLGGNTLTGGTNGIEISGNNVTIKNGFITSAAQNGVLVTGDGCRIEKCDLVMCTTGITLQGSHESVVHNCRVQNVTQAGISLQSTWTSEVSGCEVEGINSEASVYGIEALNGGNNSIVKNIIRDLQTNSSVVGDEVGGIVFDNESASQIVDNSIGAVVSLTTTAFGIYLRTCFDGVILNNTITGVVSSNMLGTGLTITTTNHYVAKNTVYDCDLSFDGLPTQYITSQANDRGAYNIDTHLTSPDTVNLANYQAQMSTVESSLDSFIAQAGVFEDRLDDITACLYEPIIAQPTTLSTPYAAYCLSDDMAGDVFITGTGITLSLNGYTISGGTNGITISGDEVVIKDGTVKNASASGIKITGNTCLLENIISKGNVSGFEIYGGARNVLRSCRAVDSTREGFVLQNAENNLLQSCEAYATSGAGLVVGIKTTGGTGNRCVDCTVNGVTSSTNEAYGLLTYNENASIIMGNSIQDISGVNAVAGIGLMGDYLISPTVDEYLFAAEARVGDIDWLNIANGTYLAFSDTAAPFPRYVRVAQFMPEDSTPLSLVTQANPLPTDISVVRWLSWQGDYYLALAGFSSGGNDVFVLKFDPALGSLTTVASIEYGDVLEPYGIDWLISGTISYLLYVGDYVDLGTYEVNAARFSGSSLVRVDTVNSPNDRWAVRSIEWQGKWLVAIGGSKFPGAVASKELQVYSFDYPPGSESFTWIADYTNSIDGDNITKVSWFEIDNRLFLAVTALPSLEVRIIEYDESSTTTLNEIASFSLGTETPNYVDTLITGTSVYVAVALTGGPAKILQFDPYTSTLVEKYTLGDSSTDALSVQWNRVSKDSSKIYLAIGFSSLSASNPAARVLGFTLNGSELCFVDDNVVSGVFGGPGFLIDPLVNGVVSNSAYNNQDGFVQAVRTSYEGVAFDTSNRTIT